MSGRVPTRTGIADAREDEPCRGTSSDSCRHQCCKKSEIKCLDIKLTENLSQMETVIKQAEENRSRSMGMANRFHEEYVPLKSEIDNMRREYLGLERLPELHEEEGSIVTPE